MELFKEKFIKKVLLKDNVDAGLVRKIAGESKTFRELKEILVKNNIVKEEEIILFLSKEYKLPYFDLDKYRVSPENKNFLPKELAFKHKVIPISKIGNVLTLAASNPLDVIVIDDIKIACSLEKIDLVLSDESKLDKILGDLYSEKAVSPSLLTKEEMLIEASSVKIHSPEENNLEEIIKGSKESPIVKLSDLIIYEALMKRASDIHIEPTQEDLSIRYRIDGILHKELSLPKKNQNAILARFKIMSSLNITEFHVPQDGRFKIKFEDREIDFRVSSLPANFGEKIVLRVLDKASLSLGLEKLGFSEIPLKLFEEAIHTPFGIILVTGPTGSGKSTTLYSVISQLNTPEKNIITIENPVEYQLEGITQIQVNPDIGLTFASALRSVLRQTPNIIMIGEIRDSETSDIAIKAALTGHLMFSTLHTNNSAGSITRLIDMGVEPFLVASSLITSTAQRLTRQLCPKCKEKCMIEKDVLEKMGFISSGSEELYKAKGCKYCNNTGYKGRVALLEILSLDNHLKEMIVKKSSEDDIIIYAREYRQFNYLKEDGFKKCREGTTSLEEVLRVAG